MKIRNLIMIMLLCWFSVAKLCPSRCDLMNFSMPDSSVFHYWSLLRFMSIESVMPSNHLILCHPLLLLPSIFPSIRVLSNESALRIRWPKYWSFSFSTSPSNEYSGLISFKIDWFDLLEVFSSTTIWKHQFLALNLLYWPTLTSIHDYWKNHSFDCIDLCQQSDVSAF